MKNRESLYPGRVKLTPVDAAKGIYDLIRADEPHEEGTPLNKKLLDFAVAACGVTAGTATAYTLDDEFGGFTLTDGAKVNFRLHVANGAGATLNVNGTGAKKIIAPTGALITPAMRENVWYSARYTTQKDAFVIAGSPRAEIIETESDATAISIPVPYDSELVKIRIHTRTTASGRYQWTLSSDIGFGTCGMQGVSNSSATGNQKTGMIQGGMFTDIAGYMDITITRRNGKSYVHLIAGSNDSFVGAATAPIDGLLSNLTLASTAPLCVFAAGTMIITEVIK